MKKILSVLGSIGITTSSVATVIACGNDEIKNLKPVSINQLTLSFDIDDENTSKVEIEQKVYNMINKNNPNEQQAELGIDYLIDDIEYNPTNSKVVEVGEVKVQALNSSKFLVGSFSITFTKWLMPSFGESKFQSFGSKDKGKQVQREIVEEMREWIPNPIEYYHYIIENNNEIGSYTMSALPPSNLKFKFRFDSIGELINLYQIQDDLEFDINTTTKSEIEYKVLQKIRNVSDPYILWNNLDKIKQGIFYDLDEIEYDNTGRALSTGTYYVYGIRDAGVFTGQFPIIIK